MTRPTAARQVKAPVDPGLARLVTPSLIATEGPLWDAVVSAAPSQLHDEPLDGALAAVAEFADLKWPYTVGHSHGVAALAERAAAQAGVDTLRVRWSALVHDVGRVAVPSPIWEKPGPLTTDAWERVRLHPYHGERIVVRSPGLSRLAAIASRHHKRCDGSGYHRGLDRGSLPPAARVLARLGLVPAAA